MASLTETAIIVRKLIIIFIGLLVLFVASLYGWKYYKIATAPKPTPVVPTLRWQIPPPKFPEQKAPSPPEITLETLTGGFPENLPSIATVSGVLQPKLTFSKREQAIVSAKNLGFLKPPEQASADAIVLTFTDDQLPYRKLTININTGNFVYNYDVAHDPTVLKVTQPFDADQAIREATRFLSNYKDIPKDLAEGSQSVQYLDFANNQFVPAANGQDATAVRVNFYRKNLFGYPVKFADPDQSPTYVIVTQSENSKTRIVAAALKYFDVVNPEPVEGDKRDSNATYFVKTPQTAFEELQKGKGYIAKNNINGNVAVTDVNFAYYEDDVTGYLYPMYVFSAEDFVGYVQAIVEAQFNQSGTSEQVKGISTQRSVVPSVSAELHRKIDPNYLITPKRFSDLLEQQGR